MTFIIIYFTFTVIINQNSFSQKIIVPKSTQIQSNNKIVNPFTDGDTKNIFKAEFKVHNVKPFSIISNPSNNSGSYTITNSKFTIIESILKGNVTINLIAYPNIKVINETKIITGKK